jgi:hypothetical protein
MPTLDRFDPSVFGFVDAVRRENPRKTWHGSETAWEDYSFEHFAEFAGSEDVPLTRAQFFRQLKLAGVKRKRSGAKDARGKRPYVYQLVSRGRPSNEVRRIRDAASRSVPS